MEKRSAEFKRMVDELVRMVREMQDAFSSSSREGGGGGGFGFGFSVNGSRAGRGSRLFAHFAHVPQGVTMRSGSRARPRSRLVRSPSDLADSRARLPPPLPASPAASSTNGPGNLYPARWEEEETSSAGALPASVSVASRLWQRVAMAESGSSPGLGRYTPRPPSPRPASAPRDLHQRLFHRTFYTPQGAHHRRSRTPSTSLTPSQSASALGTIPPPSRSASGSGSGTGASERLQEQVNLILAETRFPLESSPIPHRPLQGVFSFLNRP